MPARHRPPRRSRPRVAGPSGPAPARGVFTRFPDVGDIVRNLRFEPTAGGIWLFDQRLILMHVTAFAEQRREVIESLGLDRAREMFTRLGWYEGMTEAELGRRILTREDPADALALGPQLHQLKGYAGIEPLTLEFDVGRGACHADLIWHQTVSSEAQIEHYGVGATTACWWEVGKASGYFSAFMGRPVLFREIECRAAGHARCRGVGRPLEEWDDVEEDLRFLQVEPFMNRLGRRPGRRARGRAAAVPFGRSGAQRAVAAGEVVGASGGFNAAMHLVRKVAPTDSTVLFLGESGVGKEVFARALHAMSGRAGKPFVAVNCAAIPAELVEAELFGVEMGAYTGATESRPGRFERADRGTLFLDEIGTLSYAAQGKLLRALQDLEIEPLGATRARHVDVRLVAATNQDLRQAVAAGRFRADLFYRLNVFPVRVPPLRERRADIPLLTETFLQRLRARLSKTIPGFTTRAIDGLLGYAWPGNVRELENMLERAAILVPDGEPIDAPHLFAGGEQIEPASLSLSAAGALTASVRDALPGSVVPDPRAQLVAEALADGRTLADIVRGLEDDLIARAVERAGGNLSAAGRSLGLSYGQVAYRLRKRAPPAAPGAG